MKRAHSRAMVALSVVVLAAVAVLTVARGCGDGGTDPDPMGSPQAHENPLARPQAHENMPPVTGPHLRLTLLRIVQERDGYLRVDVRVERAGGLGPLGVTRALLALKLRKVEFSLSPGTPVFWKVKKTSETVTLSPSPSFSRPHDVPVPDPGGVTFTIGPPDKAPLRFQKPGKKRSSRIPSGSRLSYMFDEMVWCSRPGERGLFEVRMVGSGTVVFER